VGNINIKAFQIKYPDAYKQLYCSTRTDAKTDIYRTITSSTMQNTAGSTTSQTDEFNQIWQASLFGDESSSEDPLLLARNISMPMFASNRKPVNEVTDQKFMESLKSGAYQIVQEAGEMVVIPPGFYHQVYHLDETVSIASQYCNENNKGSVFDHMYNFAVKDKFRMSATIPRDLFDEAFHHPLSETIKSRREDEADAKEEVRRVFKKIIDEKYGQDSSEFIHQKLFGEASK
jgi:hypothetical protein